MADVHMCVILKINRGGLELGLLITSQKSDVNLRVRRRGWKIIVQCISVHHNYLC